MLKAVTVINRQIEELAPVLNSSDVVRTVEVRTIAPDLPVAYISKRHDGFSLSLLRRNAKRDH